MSFCEEVAKRGEKFRVKVKMGDQYNHPDDPDHYISYIQLWNRETFHCRSTFQSGRAGQPTEPCRSRLLHCPFDQHESLGYGCMYKTRPVAK